MSDTEITTMITVWRRLADSAREAERLTATSSDPEKQALYIGAASAFRQSMDILRQAMPPAVRRIAVP